MRYLGKYISILSFFLIFLQLHCKNYQRQSFGEDDAIRVLADSTMWQTFSPLLKETFEKTIITPQTETVFNVLKGDLQNFKGFKNLIFIGTLNDTGKVSKIIQKNLGNIAKQRVINDSTYVFMQKEKWAREQLILFLVAKDTATLKTRIQKNKDYLFNIFDNYWHEITKKRMYSLDEQVELSNKLLKKYQWKIRLPYDYKIFIDKPEEQFIMFKRSLPERWLFVHWIDTDNPSVISGKWCLEKRNEIGKKYYENDKIEENYVKPDTTYLNFLGRNAMKISGIWQNEQKMAGGPFRNYTFYDEKQHRIYMLDFALFQPRHKGNKRSQLRQGEILIHTFRTNVDENALSLNN